MKFINWHILFLITFYFSKILTLTFEQTAQIYRNDNDELNRLILKNKDKNFISEDITLIEPEKEIELIRKYMNDYAENLMQHSVLHDKKIFNGQLPEEFPKILRNKAKNLHYKQSYWEEIMDYPTSLYRFCIYPNFKVNYVSWCKLNFGTMNSKIRLNGCLNNYCSVCCGHLPFIYQDIIKKNKIAQKLGFSINENEKIKLKKILNKEVSEKCQEECNKKFQLSLPIVLPKPPRDPNLGKVISNPATSCADIKKWGAENAMSGEYWLEIRKKGIIKAYCDMETEEGGWTLFFNYNHLPNQDLNIDSSKMPSNQMENSHINLIDSGFTNKDVKEIRFFCFEELGNDKISWHFSTQDQNMISVALNGNQHSLRTDSFSSSYVDLKGFPNYKKKVFKEIINDFDYIGINERGGFYDTPFGSTQYEMYWTVRGTNKKWPKYECASKHDYFGGYSSPNDNPNKVKSHHMIFFRGDPPGDKMVRARLNKVMK